MVSLSFNFPLRPGSDEMPTTKGADTPLPFKRGSLGAVREITLSSHNPGPPEGL